MLKKILLGFGLCSSLFLSGCNNDDKQKSVTETPAKTLQPIVIQGAYPLKHRVWLPN